MNTKIHSRMLLVFLLSITLPYACNKDYEKSVPTATGGTLILNNGDWGANDSNIGIYDPEDRNYTADAFLNLNGIMLGDLGQDMIIFNDEVYIAVNGSRTIFVTDKNLKVSQRIDVESYGNRLSPKYMTATDSRIYVTYYEGYVGEINPSDHSVRITGTGPNPEGIAHAGGRLYVAASGGMSYPTYNNTISIVDTQTFTQIGSITVNTNPSRVEASDDGKRLYVSSFGNYSEIPPMLQVIDLVTGEITELDYDSVSAITEGKDDILYILCSGYDENFNPLPGKVYRHDMSDNKLLGEFVTDGTIIPEAYSISAADDGYVYVGCSDYRTNGDMYVFTPEGTLHDRFDTQGLNPVKAVTIK